MVAVFCTCARGHRVIKDVWLQHDDWFVQGAVKDQLLIALTHLMVRPVVQAFKVAAYKLLYPHPTDRGAEDHVVAIIGRHNKTSRRDPDTGYGEIPDFNAWTPVGPKDIKNYCTDCCNNRYGR